MFKTIKGFDNYLISDSGEIYNKITNRHKHASPNQNVQYLQISLWKDGIEHHKYVHRLVAETFIPNPENKPEVNHIDGNRQNNNVRNLEWVTSVENKVHAIKTGLHVYTNRLTEPEFIECINAVIQGETITHLSTRVPYKLSFLSVKLKQIAKKNGLLETYLQALKYQRACRNRLVLNKINSKKSSTTI